MLLLTVALTSFQLTGKYSWHTQHKEERLILSNGCLVCEADFKTESQSWRLRRNKAAQSVVHKAECAGQSITKT